MAQRRRSFALAASFAASMCVHDWAAADVTDSCVVDAETSQQLRDTGRFVEAFERLTRCARDACPRLVRNDCRQALLELRSQAPRLVVRVRTAAGADVVNPNVTIDGEAVPRSEEHTLNS